MFRIFMMLDALINQNVQRYSTNIIFSSKMNRLEKNGDRDNINRWEKFSYLLLIRKFFVRFLRN